MSVWIIDPDHSVGSFSVRHMMVANVHGQLNGVSGTVYYKPDEPSGISVELEIGVSSLFTGIQKRDDHLKSSDFFDEAQYPKIFFKTSSAELTGFNLYRIRGELTIHGISKPLSMEVRVSGPVQSPFGETSIGLTGRTFLNREDYNVSWNMPLDNGGVMVGKEVGIEVNIEADLQK